jgi:DNA modification methylase
MLNLLLGDCLDRLKHLDDNSVDSIVTDPPYGLSFMGKKWDYDVPSVEIWQECLRILKPGGHLLAFAGTRTQHRMAVRIEDAGFEIRDMIAWVYGSGFPKSTDVSRRIDLEEQKRWLDVSKALDSLEVAAIMEAWKDHSRAASTAGLSFAKSRTATGISTPKSGFAPEPVLLQASRKSSDALALVAELSSKEARLTSEAEISSAPMPAAANESQNLVKRAEHLRKRSSAIFTRVGIAQCAVKEWPSESMAGNLKAAEALKTWLGSKPSSSLEATNALCVALTDDLKLITLNQSKTFQNFDTTRQTECASAISATITESMAECLILFTVDTLRKQAIDKAAGAEREVVGVSGKSGSVRNSMAGDFAGGEYMSTAPATPEAQQWSGWGTALKPALEPITMARKPLGGRTVAANVLEHGTGAINVDGCRVSGEPWKAHAATGLGSVKFFTQGETPVIEKEPHAAGRWPANLIHDGSDEVVGLFPQTGVSKGGNSSQINVGSGRYNWNNGETQKSPDGVDPGYGDSGSAARFFYCPKASKSERGIENNHPTIKPIRLMQYLCRLITPPKGMVLDPFMGSGSTGKAALLEGFGFIGIEMDENYFHIAEKRINEVKNTPSLENFFG